MVTPPRLAKSWEVRIQQDDDSWGEWFDTTRATVQRRATFAWVEKAEAGDTKITTLDGITREWRRKHKDPTKRDYRKWH